MDTPIQPSNTRRLIISSGRSLHAHNRSIYMTLLAIVLLLGFDLSPSSTSTLVSAAPPARCVLWTRVFTLCPCVQAYDDQGNKLPSKGVVDCSNKGLNSVPEPQNIDTVYNLTLHGLHLNGNNITSLPANAFNGVKIQEIDLSGNALNDVANGAFLGSTQTLVRLTIEGNLTNKPPQVALRELHQLQKLTLRDYDVNVLEDYKYFLPFGQLRDLTLDNWQLKVIENHAFFASADSKTLSKLTILNQPIRSLPLDALGQLELENLEFLQFSFTLITEVSGHAFSSLKRIKEIILSENKIDTINDNAFFNVGDTLESIDISNNELGSNSGTNDLPHLKELAFLKRLSLAHNMLQSIPKLNGLGDGSSVHLDLSNNKITTISASDLAAFVHRLGGLDLTGNGITSIDDQAFSRATSLQSLLIKDQSGISFNEMDVPSSLTQASSSLTELDLSNIGRQLTATTLWPVVGQLKSLQIIRLASAELNAIPDFAFRNLVHLKELDLKYNNLASLNDKTFVGPRGLEILNLQSTGIKFIPKCLLHQHTSVISLDMQYTVVNCDCSIKYLVEDIENGNITFPRIESVPNCKDGSDFPLSLSQLPPNCNTQPNECIDYYAVTTQEPPQTTNDGGGSSEPTPLKIEISVVEIGPTYINIRWTVTPGDTANLEYYQVVTLSSDSTKQSPRLTEARRNITDLLPGTRFNVCVNVYFSASNRPAESQCVFLSTTGDPNTKPRGEDDDGSEANIGIIVGCVVGVLALLGIIVAIVYLVFIRRRPKKLAAGANGFTGTMQPRTFAKSELPTMNFENSRSFVKVKKNANNNNDKGGFHNEGFHDDHDDGGFGDGRGNSDSNWKPVGGGMKVVAISDGQMEPHRLSPIKGRGAGAGGGGSRVGRANMLKTDGTYEPMDGKSPHGRPSHGSSSSAQSDHYEKIQTDKMGTTYEPMHGQVNSAYENDHGSLPPTPRKHGSLPPTPRGASGYSDSRDSAGGFSIDSVDSSPRPPSYHGYYNAAFKGDTYEEVRL